ncbi:spermidine synthase [Streptacidiphilus sp. P02-A3a]|uniref:spermine/spermidine synthase domain-containing protein n=1 Tax=Streptacidiphilus sp. P02-A3a TaxID=2704468 RepID=UPI001CDC562D|nr:spermidine synthase [Streptacidiphilus sp. P02-A3a]
MITQSAAPAPTRAVGSRAARWLVLLAAFICAACGLVYELDLVALGSYLLGDSVTQVSVVLSVMVFAMGVGSLLAKRFTTRPATAFALVESALAVVGGLSVLILYGSFVWIGHYRIALVLVATVIGVLIGAEIPLLMTLIQRIRRQDAGSAVADLFAADYVGALVGGLAFPFLLLPALGQADGALVTGAVNAVAGAAVVLWLFRDEPPRRIRPLLWSLCGAVLLVLVVAAALTGAFERAARQALYGTPVRFSSQSRYQEIVLTGPGPDPDTSASTTAEAGDRVPAQRAAADGYPVRARDAAELRLYLGGRIAVCGSDQARYHAALVQPALDGGPHGSVLVLGGGDGLALRELLRDPGVRRATLVEIDPQLLGLARTDPVLSRLNGHALADPRVRVRTADAFDWLRAAVHRRGRYDVIIADLPDPDLDQARKLYTEEFYGLAERLLAPGGRLAVHAGTVTGGGYWAADAALRAVGLHTADYAVPAAGACGGPADWGFILAAREAPRLGLPGGPGDPGLDPAALRLAAVLADTARPARPVAPATLLRPG